MTFERIFSSFALAILSASAIAATPVGTLQSEGQFQVIAAGNDQPVTINQAEYTFFSGDTIIASRNDAVLNFNAGGGLGFLKGSRVTIVEADSAIEAEIAEGTVLYAFPEGRANFLFRVGNFTVQAQVPEVRSMQVNRDDESAGTNVGTIERLADGNIKATVRSGALHIRNGDSVRYQVSAGESVGLLDMPNQEIRTAANMANTGKPTVLFQSPERVGTNEEFVIRWESVEAADGDSVVIAESGAPKEEFESLVNTNQGNELEFEAPGTPGDYEIRFIDGATGEIKRFVYLDVVEFMPVAIWRTPGTKLFGSAISIAAGASAIIIIRQIVEDDPVSP